MAKELKDTTSNYGAIKECQELVNMTKHPMNQKLKEYIIEYASKLKIENEDKLEFEFEGYETASKQMKYAKTALYKGKIIFDKQNKILSGHLEEKETLYIISGKWNPKNNTILSLITTPSGEYYHLNQNTKHENGHWDTCYWINGYVNFDKKYLICDNVKWKGFKETLTWK